MHLWQVGGYEVPVHEVVHESSHVGGPHVLVVQVVGVLPHVLLVGVGRGW
jgi:hypothetical protein